MKVLLTGGTGYIGSHTAVAMLLAGHDIVLVDNFSNSSDKVAEKIESISGKKVKLYEANVCDFSKMSEILQKEKPECIVHFAGLKSVSESVEKPVDYYENNIGSTLSLLKAMAETDVKRIVFSSSATVYGESKELPFTEKMAKGECTNPYGWTKWMQEQILCDVANAYGLSVILLRYFNPVGAHESGMIGENPKGIPNNLMPIVSQVAVGKREKLTIFGKDYNTPDGTCRRDFIHVMDLAEGHNKAVEYVMENEGTEIFNLGTGKPYSVLELIKAYEDVSGKKINYEFGDRRQGDVQDSWADVSKAKENLGWTAKRGMNDMCRDAWNFISNHHE